ncbi:hypothetical protein AVEN_214228-1, partial [Araneus ventricosus]
IFRPPSPKSGTRGFHASPYPRYDLSTLSSYSTLSIILCPHSPPRGGTWVVIALPYSDMIFSLSIHSSFQNNLSPQSPPEVAPGFHALLAPICLSHLCHRFL